MSQQNINVKVKGAAKGPRNLSQNQNKMNFDEVYQFLKLHYKPSRFAERDQPGVWHDYSSCVTKSHIESLHLYGVSYISRFEDKAGVGLKFNDQLQIVS
ncbi:hypothetical protein C1N60_23315 (plasmid) [Pantoea sp. SGAir0184]|nr:hypothetical protein [Enterobacter roggenkampii]